jgi:hypothetical protein
MEKSLREKKRSRSRERRQSREDKYWNRSDDNSCSSRRRYNSTDEEKFYKPEKYLEPYDPV